jgi:hypothetical protein
LGGGDAERVFNVYENIQKIKDREDNEIPRSEK